MKAEFEKYYQTIEKLTHAANTMWSTISFISVAEIINKEVNLYELDRTCWSLKEIEMNSRKDLSAKMKSYSDDEYEGKLEEIDNELDELFRIVSNKLDAIDDTVSNLKNVLDRSEEDDYLNLFGDISIISIDENFIQFPRLKL